MTPDDRQRARQAVLYWETGQCMPHCLLGVAPRGSGCGDPAREADERPWRLLPAPDCTCVYGGTHHGLLADRVVICRDGAGDAP